MFGRFGVGGCFCSLRVRSYLSPYNSSRTAPTSVTKVNGLGNLSVVTLASRGAIGGYPTFFRTTGTCNVVPITKVRLAASRSVRVIYLFGTLSSTFTFRSTLGDCGGTVPGHPSVFKERLVVSRSSGVAKRRRGVLSFTAGLSFSRIPSFIGGCNNIYCPTRVSHPSGSIVTILNTFPPGRDFPYTRVRNERGILSCTIVSSLPRSGVVFSSSTRRLLSVGRTASCVRLPSSTSVTIRGLFGTLKFWL